MIEFLESLSSSAPVPGGGGASAVVASIGMALGSMVANLTTGKKKYAEYQSEIEEIIVKAKALTDELLSYKEKDAECFEPLAKAYGLPKNTEEEIAKKNEIMEKALYEASIVPLALMEKVIESMQILKRLSVIGSNLAISDVGVGIQMANAALNGASLNVFINTNLMKNENVAKELNEKADKLIKEGEEITKEVYDTVLGKIRKG